jgi:hypothetical protein
MTMLRTSLLILLLALSLLGLFAPAVAPQTGLIVIGGEYTIQPGETRSGNSLLIFATVNLAEGGVVAGNLRLFSSRLQVNGQVEGQIDAYGSQVSLSPSAQVRGAVNILFSLRELPLLPSILLVIS